MLLKSAPLAKTVEALRNGELDLLTYVNTACDWVEQVDPEIHALLPEPDRRNRLIAEAKKLQNSYPDPSNRPPLYGVLTGIKDIFNLEGFPTRAGSELPPELFTGPEAPVVSTLRSAGALMLGKTVTAEFAYLTPGPTRNPHNTGHTPGGSSSGSAAAVASGMCLLAVGTQTNGSIIRPAAYCGVVGFKPSFGRMSTDGVVPCAPSIDHIGIFTQDVEGAEIAASLLCAQWKPDHSARLPILGVPEGPYLYQASDESLQAFNHQLEWLQHEGYEIRGIAALEDIEDINTRQKRMVLGEMARTHSEWFSQYGPLYKPGTAASIREGQQVSQEEIANGRAGREKLRQELAGLMREHQVDIWLSPSTPAPAPEGITTTGDMIMNLPWTHAGVPVITLPAGYSDKELPLGLQCAAEFMKDEELLAWAPKVANTLSKHMGTLSSVR